MYVWQICTYVSNFLFFLKERGELEETQFDLFFYPVEMKRDQMN